MVGMVNVNQPNLSQSLIPDGYSVIRDDSGIRILNQHGETVWCRLNITVSSEVM